MRNASWRTVFTSFLFQAGFASFEFCLEKYGNLILADGILWRLNYFTSVRSRLTSAYNNNNTIFLPTSAFIAVARSSVHLP